MVSSNTPSVENPRTSIKEKCVWPVAAIKGVAKGLSAFLLCRLLDKRIDIGPVTRHSGTTVVFDNYRVEADG